MLMQTEERAVTVSGGTDSTRFRIASNAKAFKILIDKLYSDKPRAIVRELWSNAYDAHVAVGAPDKPFDTHIPTIYEPWFSVRDYGPGMTHALMCSLYSTVFESSKEADNTTVGKWGLGSKSPWSYTDTFSVTCFDGVEKRLYSAYIDDQSFPTLVLLDTSPSTEPRGVEVMVPVLTSDVDAFTVACHRTALGFSVMPNAVGTTFVSLETAATNSGVNWIYVGQHCDASLTTQFLPEFNGFASYVWQGCVLYPIDSDLIPGLSNTERAIFSGGFFLRLPIGSVDINPAREGLSYDKNTIKALRAAVKDMASDVIATHQAKVDSATNFYSACHVASMIISSFENSPLAEILEAFLTYKGKRIETSIDIAPLLVRYNTENTSYADGGLSLMPVNKRTIYGRSHGPKMRNHVFTFHADKLVKIKMADKIVVVWEDPTATIKTFAKRFTAMLLSPTYDINTNKILWVRCKKDCVALKRLLVTLDISPNDVISLSDIEYDKSVYVSGPRTKITVKEIVKGSLVETTVNSDDKVVYVPLFRGTVPKYTGPVNLDSVASCTNFYKLSTYFKALQDLGVLTGYRFIGVPKSLERMVSKNKNWKDIREVVFTTKASFDVDTLKQHRTAAHALEKTPSTLVEIFDLFTTDDVTGCGTFSAAFSMYHALTNLRDTTAVEYVARRVLLDIYDENVPYDVSTVNAYIAMLETLNTQYPLLLFLATSRPSFKRDASPDVINYVKVINAASVDVTPASCDKDVSVFVLSDAA